MCAASHLPGKGPTDVNDALAPVDQKSDYDMMMMLCNAIYKTKS